MGHKVWLYDREWDQKQLPYALVELGLHEFEESCRHAGLVFGLYLKARSDFVGHINNHKDIVDGGVAVLRE